MFLELDFLYKSYPIYYLWCKIFVYPFWTFFKKKYFPKSIIWSVICTETTPLNQNFYHPLIETEICFDKSGYDSWITSQNFFKKILEKIKLKSFWKKFLALIYSVHDLLEWIPLLFTKKYIFFKLIIGSCDVFRLKYLINY